jgi:hypothetical protein
MEVEINTGNLSKSVLIDSTRDLVALYSPTGHNCQRPLLIEHGQYTADRLELSTQKKVDNKRKPTERHNNQDEAEKTPPKKEEEES